MNKKQQSLLTVFIYAFCILHAALTPSSAAFKDSGWGVRPAGMGSAFSAIADDANAPLFNPAGITQVSNKEVTLMSSKLYTGLEGVDIGKNYFAFILPVNRHIGNFGLTWASLYSPGLYREDTVALTYAKPIKKDLFSAGFNVKYLEKNYELDVRTVNDPVFAEGSSKGAIAFDAGLLFTVSQYNVALALVSKNVNKPDMGLKTQDLVENENVVGLSYYAERVPYFRLRSCTLAIDYVNRADVNDVRFGAETWFFSDTFAARLGGRMQELTFGLGYELAFGESDLTIDYAFGWPLEIEESSGSHRIGISIRF